MHFSTHTVIISILLPFHHILIAIGGSVRRGGRRLYTQSSVVIIICIFPYDTYSWYFTNLRFDRGARSVWEYYAFRILTLLRRRPTASCTVAVNRCQTLLRTVHSSHVVRTTEEVSGGSDRRKGESLDFMMTFTRCS